MAALNGPQEIVRERCLAFQARRDFLVAALNRIPGLVCQVPEGAFYTFVNCVGLIGRTTPDGRQLNRDTDVAEYLLRQVGVAVVPGSAFGLARYFRISYATSLRELEEACRRIDLAFNLLT